MKRGRSIADLSRLDGRVALLIGGAGHIGREIADGLAEQGANIAIVDLNGESAHQTSTEIQSRHSTKTFALEVDLSVQTEVEMIVPKVLEQFGRIDILVHLAAFVDPELEGWTCRFEDQSPDTWRRGIEVNLTSAFLLAKACAPPIRASGHGSMIFFGSTYGVVGPDWSIYNNTNMGNAAGYAASKGGIIQLARWLSTTLAPEIRVNSLSPGGVFRDHVDSFKNAYSKKTPLGRMATEEDYKGATLFLASDMSAYVTGHNLMVDGGWTAW